jgi:predicted transcriptional regulator
VKDVPLPSNDLEYDVLCSLWELGMGSVREVHDQVGQRERRGLTTTAKAVERLCKKGLVERHLSGMYRPLVTREQVERARANKGMSKLFGAAPHAPVAALVDPDDPVDSKLVDDLERVIARRRRKDGA